MLNTPASTPIVMYTGRRNCPATNPVADTTTTSVFEAIRPTMNASSIGTPRPAFVAPADGGDQQGLRPGLRPDAVDHPHAERRPVAVRAHLQRGDVLVPVEARLEAAPAVAGAVEDEHPAAAQPELRPVAQVLPERDEDPDPEEQEREADDPAHDRVHPVGQDRAEREREHPEREHDEGVPQGVQRAQDDRVALLADEPRAPDADPRQAGHRRDGGPAGLVHRPSRSSRRASARGRATRPGAATGAGPRAGPCRRRPPRSST